MPDDPTLRPPYIDRQIDSWKLAVMLLLFTLLVVWALFWLG